MKRIYSLALCLVAISSLFAIAAGQSDSRTQSAQTNLADGKNRSSAAEPVPYAIAVLHKAQHALGGAERLRAIHDVTREVEMVNLATKETARSTSQIIFPDVIRLSSDSPFGQIIAFCDGQTAWESSPLGIDNRLPNWQIKASRQDLYRQLESLLLSDQDPDRKVEAAERGKVNGWPADSLKISSASAGTVRIWVDAGSGDLLEMEYQRVVAKGEGPLIDEFYSDYRWVNKTVRVPFHIHTLSDGEPYMDTEIVRAEYNKGLKADVLAQKPSASQQ